MLRNLFCCCLFLLSIAAPRTADAFVLFGTKWPQSSLGAQVTLTYSYSNLFDGGLLDSSGQPVSTFVLRTSIEQALAQWAAVAPLNFVEVSDVGPAPTDFEYSLVPGEAQLRFGHHYIDGFVNVKAHGYYPDNSGLSGLAGDVHFDDADRWNLVGSLTYPDILGAAEHEIGHALGLDHSLDIHAIMYPTFKRMQGLGTGYLTADDVAGIRAIYGSGVGSVTPLVPEPSTLMLLVIGLAALPLVQSRRRRSQRNRL